VAAMSRPTSFYYAFLMLPRPQREAMIAVWDFCRAVDDEVDEPAAAIAALSPDERRAAIRTALNRWRAEIGRCYHGTPESPQGRALQPWVRHFTLSREPLDDLVDGVEMDLDRDRYASFDDLYEYCRRVASAVGYVCVEIFGQRSAAAREYALNLGLALQLTNILRDVGGDAARGRIYLPQEDLARFGCTDADLRATTITPRVAALLAFESGRAREFYDRAARVLPSLDRRAMVAAEIMGRIYREILIRVERAGYDVFSSRVRVTKARQATLAIGTWLRTRLAPHAPA
jgi:phytoene synthase